MKFGVLYFIGLSVVVTTIFYKPYDLKYLDVEYKEINDKFKEDTKKVDELTDQQILILFKEKQEKIQTLNYKHNVNSMFRYGFLSLGFFLILFSENYSIYNIVKNKDESNDKNII